MADQSFTYHQRCTTFIAACMLACFISACSTLEKDTVYSKPAIRSQTIEQQIEYWLNQAESADTSEADNARLQAGMLLLENKQPIRANAMLEPINTTSLNTEQTSHYYIARASLALLNNDHGAALSLLNNEQLLAPGANATLQANAGLLRARAYAANGQAMASLEERVFISPLLDDDNKSQQNHAAIWLTLQTIPAETIKSTARSTQSEALRGWLTLALINKMYAQDIFKQRDQLTIWQSEWNKHPAQQNLPQELQALFALDEDLPSRITMLLPFNGKLANVSAAIRDGFMAAFYNSGMSDRLEISIVDSTAHESFSGAYAQALSQTPDMIIGPLQKPELAALPHLVTADGPRVLALNYIEKELSSTSHSINNSNAAPIDNNYAGADTAFPEAKQTAMQESHTFFQFGLAATDEARQLAKQLSFDRPQRALIIRPAGRWGERVSDAFREPWLAAGATILDEIVYRTGANFSGLLRQALLVEQSEGRKNRLQNLLQQKLEFTPRRRQDMDLIFLAARPAQGRSLKPILAFHYAGNVPVYATSQIFSGITQAHKDRDLNGVTFTETPWLLDPENPLRKQLSKQTNNQSLSRMHALGVDAFQLTARLGYLSRNPGSRFSGVTGQLSMDPQRVIHRELDIAKIVRGIPKRQPPIATSPFEHITSDLIGQQPLKQQ